jgi:hypothetical protein
MDCYEYSDGTLMAEKEFQAIFFTKYICSAYKVTYTLAYKTLSLLSHFTTGKVSFSGQAKTILLT